MRLGFERSTEAEIDEIVRRLGRPGVKEQRGGKWVWVMDGYVTEAERVKLERIACGGVNDGCKGHN